MRRSIAVHLDVRPAYLTRNPLTVKERVSDERARGCHPYRRSARDDRLRPWHRRIHDAVVLGINFGYLAFFNLLQNSALVIPVKVIAMAITGAVAGGLMGSYSGRESQLLRKWPTEAPRSRRRSCVTLQLWL
jgi:hypothetical protein